MSEVSLRCDLSPVKAVASPSNHPVYDNSSTSLRTAARMSADKVYINRRYRVKSLNSALHRVYRFAPAIRYEINWLLMWRPRTTAAACLQVDGHARI